MKLIRIRMFAIRLLAMSLGSFPVPVQNVSPCTLTRICGRAKDVVAAMIKRLAHRNANVQLYTLEVGRGALGTGAR